MDQDNVTAERFQAHRAELRAVAYRMLGSGAEADDAVQETWLRLQRSDADAVQNLGGWLRTVLARVCLDMLRSRTARRETPLDWHEPQDVSPQVVADPESEIVLADAVGDALLVVLDTLAPAERLAFVLHDLFGVPFDEVAAILGRSPTAARQLASRARRRVQGRAQDDTATPDADRATQRRVVEAFLAASRNGDFQGLLDLLDPEAVIRADSAAVRIGATELVRGAAAVAGTFSGRAQAARLALVDGYAGAAWMQGGHPKVVFAFTLEAGRVVEIEMLSDPGTLADLDLAPAR